MAKFGTPGIKKLRFYDRLNFKNIKKICMEKVVGSMTLLSSIILRRNPLYFPIKNSNVSCKVTLQVMAQNVIYLSRTILVYYCKCCSLIG